MAVTSFMEFLDGTILITALPSISADFQVPATELNITMSGYLLAAAAGIPLGGWMADRFGVRLVFCLAIALFVFASVACSLSQDVTTLTISRIVQGGAGATMVPVGTLLVLRSTAKGDLLRATAFLIWPGLVAPVLAPVVGGALTTFLSWHWIFLINLPLGITALVAAVRLIPPDEPQRSRQMDWLGLLLTTTGLGALMAGLELAGSHVGSFWSPALAAFGALGIMCAVLWMRHVSYPLFDLKVFSVRTFRSAATGGFCYRLSISAVPFLLPLMFQTAFGWSPLRTGAMVAAIFIGNICIKPVTTPLIRRFGFRTTLIFASLTSASTFVLCATLTERTPDILIFALLACSGAFRSIGFSAYASLQYADIDAAQIASATTLSATILQVSTAAGIAVAALLVRLFEALAIVPQGPSGPFQATFLAISVLMLVSTVDSLFLARNAGAEVSRHGQRSVTRKYR